MEPTTGTVEVSVTTTGDDPDPDGYTVQVGTSHSSSVAVDDSVTFSQVETGSYDVQITGLAENCTVQGQHPVTVTVSSGATATVNFTVSCEALTGELAVSASTSGGDQDTTGYVVTVDSAATDTIGANGSTTFGGLLEGDHQVELSDVQDNCTVQGENPRTVPITPDSTSSTSFSVDCTAVTGDLVVSASTSGDSTDTDGYRVALDGADTTSLGTNDSVTYEGLSEGDHQVEILDVNDNCSVDGSRSRSVAITAGDTSSVDYAVTCHSAAGDLKVVASTSGEDPDSTGYVVTVDDSLLTDTIAADDSTTFRALEAGDHRVELSDVEENCTVQGENPRTVTVPADSTARSAYAVDCVERVGELVVETETTGEDRDSTGYTVTLDGGVSTSIGNEDSVSFGGVDVGEHEIELSGLAENCSVEGDNPRTVSVAFDSTTTESVTVDCAATRGDLEIVAETSGDSTDSDGYEVTVDGTRSDSVEPEGSVTFEDLSEGDHEVAFSDVQSNCTVDGANPRTLGVTAGQTTTDTVSVACEAALLGPIVFASYRPGSQFDIFAQNPDGTGLTRLTQHPAEDRWPDVSPGGTRIAFASEREEYRNDEIVVLHVAGDSLVRLTNADGNDNQPVWSPDGTRIAFVSQRSGTDDIYVMDADGSNLQRVTESPADDGSPAWSPDGDHIYFHSDRDGDREIFRIRPDGTGVDQITNNSIEDQGPSVSPDGSTLAFARGFSISSQEIYTMDLDDGDVQQLTDNSAGDANPAWSPDGGHLAFETTRDGNREIYVMDADGSNQENVTGAPALDFWPSWTPQR